MVINLSESAGNRQGPDWSSYSYKEREAQLALKYEPPRTDSVVNVSADSQGASSQRPDIAEAALKDGRNSGARVRLLGWRNLYRICSRTANR